MCSFAGTGNVLKVQELLHYCDEHIDKTPKEKKDDKDTTPEEPAKDDTFQAFAVIGIALVAMGEDVGAEMSLRQFNHLVRDSPFPLQGSDAKSPTNYVRCITGTQSFAKLSH